MPLHVAHRAEGVGQPSHTPTRTNASECFDGARPRRVALARVGSRSPSNVGLGPVNGDPAGGCVGEPTRQRRAGGSNTRAQLDATTSTARHPLDGATEGPAIGAIDLRSVADRNRSRMSSSILRRKRTMRSVRSVASFFKRKEAAPRIRSVRGRPGSRSAAPGPTVRASHGFAARCSRFNASSFSRRPGDSGVSWALPRTVL